MYVGNRYICNKNAPKGFGIIKKSMTKRWLPVWLMVVSLALLLAFFVFWLHQSYQKEQDWLRREVYFAFSESLHSMQDSLVSELLARRIEDNTLDQLILSYEDTTNVLKSAITTFGESDLSELNIRIGRIFRDSMDSKSAAFMVDSLDDDSTLSKIKTIYIKPNNSSKNPEGRRGRHAGNQFRKSIQQIRMLSLAGDTLSLDSASLALRYSENLANNGIPLASFIKITPTSDSIQTDREKIQTYAIPAGIPPELSYSAGVLNPQWYLLSNIVPEIGVSLFLLLIVLLSYTIIWKNLQKQKRLNVMKNDFISNITHELKTPISTVSVAVEAIQHFNVIQDTHKTKEYLSMAQSELSRLSLLVDKILKTSLFEQEMLTMDKQKIDMKAMISRVMEAMKLPMEKKKANLSCEMESGDFHVLGDESHLTNVLINLLDNAIKYHSGQPNISVHLQKQNNQLSLLIKDDGPGISREYQEKIFERFFRVPQGDTHNVKGYGLGLSYVADVVTRHQGKIKMVSHPGAGSTFIIQLPLIDATH